MNKRLSVHFVDNEIKRAYEKLKERKGFEQKLYRRITEVINRLKEDYRYGTLIPKKNIPQEYIRLWGITNLYKVKLIKGWRLFYTIAGNEVEIVSIILDWMNHKTYMKLFKRKK